MSLGTADHYDAKETRLIEEVLSRLRGDVRELVARLLAASQSDDSSTTPVLPPPVKDQTGSTRDPGPTDNLSKGYSSRSFWINRSTNKVFICITSTSTGAVWSELSNVEGLTMPTVINYFNSRTTSDIAEGSNLYYTDQRVANHPDVVAARQLVNTTGNRDSSSYNTTGGSWATALEIATMPDVTFILNVTIVARRYDLGGETAGYSMIILCENRNGDAWHKTKRHTVLEAASPWNVRVRSPQNKIRIQVKGEDGKSIHWDIYTERYNSTRVGVLGRIGFGAGGNSGSSGNSGNSNNTTGGGNSGSSGNSGSNNSGSSGGFFTNLFGMGGSGLSPDVSPRDDDANPDSPRSPRGQPGGRGNSGNNSPRGSGSDSDSSE